MSSASSYLPPKYSRLIAKSETSTNKLVLHKQKQNQGWCRNGRKKYANRHDKSSVNAYYVPHIDLIAI